MNEEKQYKFFLISLNEIDLLKDYDPNHASSFLDTIILSKIMNIDSTSYGLIFSGSSLQS